MSENFFIEMQSPILSVCDSQKGPPAAEQTQLMRTSQQYNNNLNRVAMEDEKNAPKKPDNTELAFKLYDKDKGRVHPPNNSRKQKSGIGPKMGNSIKV